MRTINPKDCFHPVSIPLFHVIEIYYVKQTEFILEYLYIQIIINTGKV
jgi:hypothetical protein